MLLRMKGKRSLLGITLELFQAHSIVTLSFIFKVLFYAFSFVILGLNTAIHKPYWFLPIYWTPSNNLYLNLLIKTIVCGLSIKGFFFSFFLSFFFLPLNSSVLLHFIHNHAGKKKISDFTEISTNQCWWKLHFNDHLYHYKCMTCKIIFNISTAPISPRKAS